MDWKKSLGAVLKQLQAELRKRRGVISELEDEFNLSRSFLSRSINGGRIRLDMLLKILDRIDTEPGSFFAQALDTEHTTEDFLSRIDTPMTVYDALRPKVLSAASEVANSKPAVYDGKPRAQVCELPKVTSCGFNEQKRRLRSTNRYRSQEFTDAYLEYLDSLRYDEPLKAAKLAACVIIDQLPLLHGNQRGRLELLCRALGIFGSVRRVKGNLGGAAQIFLCGIKLAKENRLRDSAAELLQRASYLFRDLGLFHRALAALQEATLFYVEIGSEEGLCKTTVDRAMMLCSLGEYEDAIFILERNQHFLARCDAAMPRTRFTACELLAYANERRGEYAKAEEWLSQALEIPGLERGFYWAKLEWHCGNLAARRGDLDRAEKRLRSAAAVLAKIENPMQEVLINIDLIHVFLLKNNHDQVLELAGRMIRNIEPFKDHRLAASALLALHSATMAGKLSAEVLREIRSKLKQVEYPKPELRKLGRQDC